MTWPTTPIPTTNLDAGSDQPRLARADLKQMADAVNDIQATFDINGASDGDIIVYNNSTSTWEYTDGATYIASNSTPSIVEALIKVDSGQTTLGTTGSVTLPISEVYDTNGLISISSNTFTLGAGNYAFQMYGRVSSETEISLRNHTTGNIEHTFNSAYVFTSPSTYKILWSRIYYVTLTSSRTYKLTFEATSGGSVIYYYGGAGINEATNVQDLLVRKLP